MKNFGIRLTNLRKSKGLTIEELAKELNMPIGSLKCWEKDKMVFSIKTIIIIAKYFKVSVDYLLGL